MQKILLKIFNVFAFALHPKIPFRYSYFIRDNYYSRFFQNKYFFKDYGLKKEYKIIEYEGEFQQELTFVLPFAYWHFLNGTLLKTISCKDTKQLYFFSKDHIEVHQKREWLYNNKTYEFPNMTHSISFSYKKWVQVPLKQQYKNDIFIFEKPILIIANKYNIEWASDPINFLDLPTLDKIINQFNSKYKIVYNRPLATEIVSDNSEILDLKDDEWLRKNHPEVVLMNDLFVEQRSSVENFNHLQLMVYANCNHFISVHGGTAALASYFGGTNIIFSKKGLEHLFNEFEKIFPKLSGANILHATSVEQIFDYLNSYY